jgi:uncharacterized protein (DUF952 family)
MGPVENSLYHIATTADWRPGLDAYAPQSFAAEGFIHCSTREQLLRVANARFRGRLDLILLRIDATLVQGSVRYENLEGGTELYPHLYGRLVKAAVVEATPFPPNADGEFDDNVA